MVKHYLKVAFRNLWKYKWQTLISVAGLAVGFACFAMAMLWIRYEMTYDSFHKNADRIYCVILNNSDNKISRTCPRPLSGYLKATFPEIANSIPIGSYASVKIELDGIENTADAVNTDSSFFNTFDVKVIEGSKDFLIPENKSIAITAEKARQWFGNESPIGKKIKYRNYGVEEYTVSAVVTGLPKRSNYPFDILMPLTRARASSQWYYWGEEALVELAPGIDAEAFGKKLYEHTVKNEVGSTIPRLSIVPLTSIRYTDPNVNRDVKFRHIIIFSIAGLLLVLCTLFNYLTLFISRFRLRQRELALRVVCGASNRSLFALLSVEFFMSLIIALLSGLFIINAIVPVFRQLSGIKLELSLIYFESLIYISVIILVSLLIFILTLAIFRRRTLSTSIQRSNRKMFRKISIAFQLVISIGFMFCTVIILKQMYHLHNTDFGFAIKNNGSVGISGRVDMAMLEDKIRQIPEITGTLRGNPLIPISGSIGTSISKWDDKPANAKDIDFGILDVSEQLLSYYEFRLVEGEFLKDTDADTDVLINESALKAFGWHSAVGKTFSPYDFGPHKEYTCTVKGVVKNIYNMSPTISAKPFYYRLPNPTAPIRLSLTPSILFKYNEGAWQTCRKKIEEIFAKEYPNNYYTIRNAEEEYDKFLKSENTLLRILTVVSLVCVIVCVFGFVSIVSLTCEERRKEIAIRKINGATVKDILDIFFKEHLTLLAVGALIAFPIGYLTMRRWLEEYVVQTEMSAWIYVAILLALIMAVVVCVGGKVYKTSRENPVNSISKL
jgi:hypothetical protein